MLELALDLGDSLAGGQVLRFEANRMSELAKGERERASLGVELGTCSVHLRGSGADFSRLAVEVLSQALDGVLFPR